MDIVENGIPERVDRIERRLDELEKRADETADAADREAIAAYEREKARGTLVPDAKLKRELGL